LAAGNCAGKASRARESSATQASRDVRSMRDRQIGSIPLCRCGNGVSTDPRGGYRIRCDECLAAESTGPREAPALGCPVCKVEPYERCVNIKGRTMLSSHRMRELLASNQV
jgi:hypothetical protein